MDQTRRQLRRAKRPETWRTIWWTLRALFVVRVRLGTVMPADIVLRQPATALGDHETPIVRRMLSLGRASCLERSLVLQRWFANLGREFDLIVGVSNDGGFRAHAWLAGTEPKSEREFAELMRVGIGANAGGPEER